MFLSIDRDHSPVFRPCQRRPGHRVGVFIDLGLVIVHLGKLDRQVRVLQSDGHSIAVVDDGEGLTPIALAAEEPVAQLVVNRSAAEIVFFEPARDPVLRLRGLETIDDAGVDGSSVGGKGGSSLDFSVSGSFYHLDDRNLELRGEFEIAAVVGRYRHDGPGSVTHEHVVGDEDRHLLRGNRVHRPGADEDPGLFLFFHLPFDVGL